jgi:LDH2 family malate/lactate/ureidoglycolate dehydrogenase
MIRYSRDALVAFASSLLRHAGLDRDKAEVTADGLVTADAMGHSTHGLALLPEYLDEIAAGSMTRSGEPAVLADREAAQVWDGRRLPGLWLTKRALDAAASRAARLGTASVVVRRSHHIGALAAFLPRHAENGLMALVTCSDPSDAQVAPFGSAEPLLTPDPIAAVIPTQEKPVLIDISSSITTAAMTARLAAEGRRYPAAWAIDAAGAPSEDPSVLGGKPRGALLPIGGLDHGHKGFALALLIEALTQGLSGYGRADAETQWGASVYVQVWDPSLYGGLASFERQTSWLAAACRACRPQDPEKPVRVPGQFALESLAAALVDGIVLHDSIMPPLREVAVAWNITPPPSKS